MSILIKGMEMPTKCTVCPFVRDIGDYTFVGCKLNVGFAINRAFPYRHNYCPLVPVPPHGRLIDADAILNSKGVGTQIAGWGKMYHETVIEYAPTVIPAESEGE